MVVESWNRSKRTKVPHFLHEALFVSTSKSMHKNIRHGAHGHLWVMGLKREESRRVALCIFWSLSEVLEVKDGLDRLGIKNRLKLTHWNVAPDALPGSARLARVLDAGLMTGKLYAHIRLCIHAYK